MYEPKRDNPQKREHPCDNCFRRDRCSNIYGDDGDGRAALLGLTTKDRLPSFKNRKKNPDYEISCFMTSDFLDSVERDRYYHNASNEEKELLRKVWRKE
ncbi:MAG: hypothetical protein LBD23_10420 [Oscillospiraceae bacterium]|nr:hypothetical protein [Oscillospiraceae bacterium]